MRCSRKVGLENTAYDESQEHKLQVEGYKPSKLDIVTAYLPVNLVPLIIERITTNSPILIGAESNMKLTKCS